MLRGTRQPGCRRHGSRSTGCVVVIAPNSGAHSSREPSSSGSVSSSHGGPRAPGPAGHRRRPLGESSWVPGPSGVRAVRHSPDASTTVVGSPPPRRSGPRVARRSTGRPGCVRGLQRRRVLAGRDRVVSGHRRQSSRRQSSSSSLRRTDRSGSVTPTQTRVPGRDLAVGTHHRVVADDRRLDGGPRSDPGPGPDHRVDDARVRPDVDAVLQHRAVHHGTGRRPGRRRRRPCRRRRSRPGRPPPRAARATPPAGPAPPTSGPPRGPGRGSR